MLEGPTHFTLLLKKISDTNIFIILFGLFLSEMLSRRSRLSRTTSDSARKSSGKFQAKIPNCDCFSGEIFGTILSRRSQLLRTSRAPSRLIWPRPINCNRGRPHGDLTRSTHMDPAEWRCVCVDDMEEYNYMMCRDLWSVMHRIAQWKVEHQDMRRVAHEKYICSESMGELRFGEEICWA